MGEFVSWDDLLANGAKTEYWFSLSLFLLEERLALPLAWMFPSIFEGFFTSEMPGKTKKGKEILGRTRLLTQESGVKEQSSVYALG